MEERERARADKDALELSGLKVLNYPPHKSHFAHR